MMSRLLLSGLVLLCTMVLLTEAMGIHRAHNKPKIRTTVRERGVDGVPNEDTIRSWRTKGKNSATVVLHNRNGIQTVIEPALNEKPQEISEKEWNKLTPQQRDELERKRAEEAVMRETVEVAEELKEAAADRERINAIFARVSFQGLCTFAKSKCPLGWSKKGGAAFIYHKNKSRKTPFKTLSTYSPKWKFSEGVVCCGASQLARINNQMVLGRRCTGKLRSQALIGFGTAMADKAPFFVGAAMEEFSVPKNVTAVANVYQPPTPTENFWSHPFLCKTKRIEQLRETQSCLLATKCPEHSDGRWIDMGVANLLSRTKDRKAPFVVASKFNRDFNLMAARVCCLAL